MDFNKIIDNIVAFFCSLYAQLSGYFSSIDASRVLTVVQYDPRNPLLFSSGAFLFVALVFFLCYCLLRKQLSARCNSLFLLFLL